MLDFGIPQESSTVHSGAKLGVLWHANLGKHAREYQRAQPFPHVVLDQFLPEDLAVKAARAFPAPESGEWIQYRHFNSRKLGQNQRSLLPPVHLEIIEALSSEAFLDELRLLTGISNLVADPYLEGGGMHQITRGGFLNVHADFTAHSREPLWARRVNLLLYLNENWLDSYGGHLELWDRRMQRCEEKILPIANRCVIFNTDFDTFHGHPHPLTCPENVTRKSIALYYFSPEKAKPRARSTEYRALPQDSGLKRVLIFFDKLALRAYDFARRRLGLDDRLLSRILRWFR